MICANKNCGAELPGDAIYCFKCGRKQIRERSRKLRGNGTGSVYKRGDTWTVDVTLGWKKDKDGKRLRVHASKGGFRTKKEALEAIPALQKHGAATKTATLSNLYDGWSSSALLKLSKSKQCAYRIAYNKIDSISLVNIAALTIHDLQECIDENTTSYYTAKDVKQLLSHLYKRAVAQGNVLTNLADFIVLPDLNEKETVPFSQKEQATLWEEFSKGNDFPGYLLLMIYTGMMPGELMNVEKDMINWEAQTITGCGLKTKKRKETPILLPDVVLPVLVRLSEVEGDKLWPYSRDDFYDVFNAYKDLTGLNRELRPYSCRHSSATSLDEAGIAPTIIKEIMRHTRFATTEKYIHKDTSAILAEINAKIKKPTTNTLP